MTELFVLGDRQVHVWQSELAGGESCLRDCRKILSPSEQARAAKFKFESDRSRWIAARATLRRLLSRYLNVPAAEIDIRRSEKGKPYVAAAFDFEFNVSHSGGVALYAFSRKPVGIDIEAMREVPEALAIAGHYLSGQDLQALAESSAEARSAAFLRSWVRHEALLKAQGVGLTGDRSAAGTPENAADEWDLVDLDVPSGYAAALAMSHSFTIDYKSWALDAT